jgi:hypothetical protein
MNALRDQLYAVAMFEKMDSTIGGPISTVIYNRTMYHT